MQTIAATNYSVYFDASGYEKLASILVPTHYSKLFIIVDENTSEQRHGLGLLIVKQIAAAHKGTVEIRHSKYGGLEVEICLPV